MIFSSLSPQRRNTYLNIFLIELLGITVLWYVVLVPHTAAPTTEILNPVQPPNAGPLMPSTEEKNVVFETIEKGFNSDFTVRRNYVVRVHEDWKNLWGSMHANVVPLPKLPSVDFGTYFVVAVFLGERPTGGHSIEITRVVETEQAVRAYVQETNPPPDTMVTQAFTQPYHIIKISRTEKQVVFE